MAGRRCPGIDLLRKDMLAYELRIRGESEQGTVAELATRLRDSLDKPVTIRQEQIGEVATALTSLQSSVQVISESLSYMGTPTPKQLDRVRAHLTHLLNRVKDLESLGIASSLQAEANSISKAIMSLLLEVPSLGLDKNIGGGVLELQESTPSVTQAVEGAAIIESPGGSPSPLSPQKFATLPNPILCLLKNIERISVNTKEGIRQLLWLLVDFEQHADAFSLSHSVIWTLLYPLAEGKLKTLFAQAIRKGESLQQFRERLVKEQLPFRLCRDIEEEFLWRLQGSEESLDDYMERVRIAFLALKPDMPEGRVVSNIIAGMCPQYRTQLLVLGRPTQWDQLIQATNEIGNCALVDEQRNLWGVNSRSCLPSSAGNPGSSAPSREKRCFRCGATDHLVRSCPVPREGRPTK